MEISITIINALTDQVEFNSKDSLAEVSIDAAHKLYSEAYPNSHVNFFWGEEGSKSFICGIPHNMKRDEILYNAGLMTWEDYCKKWYKGALSGCNED